MMAAVSTCIFLFMLALKMFVVLIWSSLMFVCLHSLVIRLLRSFNEEVSCLGLHKEFDIRNKCAVLFSIYGYTFYLYKLNEDFLSTLWSPPLTSVKGHSDPWPKVTDQLVRFSINVMTLISSLTFIKLCVVYMEYLQRVWHVYSLK